MSNDNNNLTLSNGVPNLANPRVLAAFIDGMGVLLAPMGAKCGNANIVRPVLSDEDIKNIVTIYRTLGELRNAIGIEEDWYNESQHDLIGAVLSDGDRKRKAETDAIVKAMLAVGMPLDLIPPEMRPQLRLAKPDAATTADALLDQLRADGVIG